jgi:inner membrane protein
MGLKLLVVSGLALIMTIPALFVDNIIDERSNRAKSVIQEVSGRVGGQQTFLGPSLSIPYTIPPLYKGASPVLGVYVVFPAQGDATIKVRTQERRRSLFKVPVFQADLKFDATFDLAGVPSNAPPDAVLDWTRAGIVIGVSDARGALADGTLRMNGKTVTFAPAGTLGDPEHLTTPAANIFWRERGRNSPAECHVSRDCSAAFLRRTADFGSRVR